MHMGLGIYSACQVYLTYTRGNQREEASLYQTTIKIDGMMCSMCEAHVCDAIRKLVPKAKVKANHSKGICVAIWDEPLSEGDIRTALDPTGYRVIDVAVEPYEKKKGLFK